MNLLNDYNVVNDYLNEGEFTSPEVIQSFKNLTDYILKIYSAISSTVNVSVEYSADEAGNLHPTYFIDLVKTYPDGLSETMRLGQLHSIEEGGISQAAMITLLNKLRTINVDNSGAQQ